MTDFSAAEHRLTAALERLDRSVERAARRLADRGPADGAAAGQSETAAGRVTPAAPPLAEMEALRARQGATLEAMQMRLSEAHERLAGAGHSAAALAAANEALTLANRDLIEQLRGGVTDAEPAIRAALDAEIESLRAARDAEVAQMGEILDALDRMLGVTTTPRSHSTAGRAQARRAGAGRDRGDQPLGAGVRQPAGTPADQSTGLRDLTIIRDEEPPWTDDTDAGVDDLSTADPSPANSGTDADDTAASNKERR